MTVKFSKTASPIQYYSAPDDPAFTFPAGGTQFTIAFILTLDGDTTSASPQYIISTGAFQEAGSFHICYNPGATAGTNTGNRIGVYRNTSSTPALTSSTVLTAGQSYLFAFVQTSSGLACYRCPILSTEPVDGSAVVSEGNASVNSIAMDGPRGLFIGSRGDLGTTRLLDNSIGRVFFMQGALSTLEIAQLAYGKEITALGKTPVWYARLDTVDDFAAPFSKNGSPVTSTVQPAFGYAPLNSAPAITGNPTIVGSPQAGVASSYTPASRTGAPTPTRTQQWSVDGVDVPSTSGGIGATFTPSASDAGKVLRVKQIETNGSGTASATSAPVSIASPSVTDTVSPSALPAERIYQRSAGAAVITMAGSFAGTVPTSVEYQLWDEAGTTVLSPWTTLPSLAVNGENFTGSATVSQGGMYRRQMRTKNGTTILAIGPIEPELWGVGDLFVVVGSSSAAKRFDNTSGSSLTPAANVRKYASGTWAKFGTIGCAITEANGLAAQAGVPVGMISQGTGGSTLTGWLNQTGSYWPGFKTAVSAVGGKLAGAFVFIGSNDVAAGSVVSRAAHADKLRTFIGNIRNYTGQSSLPILLSGMNRRTLDSEPGMTDYQADYVRMAENDVGDDAGVTHVSTMDLIVSTVDGTHLVSGTTGFQASAARNVAVFGRRLYGDNAYLRGPKITSIVVNGTSGVVTLAHRNGADFVPATGITGFAASSAGSAVTVTAARQDATHIALTFSATPDKVTYLAGAYPVSNTDAPQLAMDNGTAALPMAVESDLPITVQGTVTPDTDPPAMPSGLAISSITSGGFTASWDADADAASYEMSVDTGSASYSAIGKVQSKASTGLAASTLYTIRLVALDAAGNRSAPALATATTASAGTTSPVGLEHGLRVNTEFAALLSAAATSNTTWSNAFKSGLGATRRVICKIAPAGTARASIYSGGTTFRDAAITGEMTIEAGIVTKYGTTSDLTTSLAADLAAGVAVLRIEGNGNWIEGTLGLSGSKADFIVPSNPTATNSIAVTPNLRIKPPPFLPSGPESYPPPALSADAPAYIIIEDWRDPSNVVEAGRVHFNERWDNFVFTDKEVAAGMGDVRVTGSTETVTFGPPGADITFGFVLFSQNAAVNGETSRARHQILGAMTPTEANWPGYPRYSGYRLGTRTFDATVSYGVSNTFPEAFKWKICRADGSVIYVGDMDRDHLAINSPELSEVPTLLKPVRPHMNSGQMLFWESHKAKMSTYSKKWFPGLDERLIRHTINKEKADMAGVAPMVSLAGQIHAAQHWYAHGKYAQAISLDAVNADLSLDPYLFGINPDNSLNTDNALSTPPWASVHGVPQSEFNSIRYNFARLMGLFYEPGGQGCHDYTTAPGGVRVDRSFMAGPVMIYLTNPNWVHQRTQLPISTLVEHWNKSYFNHACHYVTNARTFETLPVTELLEGKWSFSKSFYGPNNSYTAGGTDYAVPQFCTRIDGTTGTRNTRPHGGIWTDANYRMPWNHYAVDGQHDYHAQADTAIHFNSPAHAYSAKHRYLSSLMTGLADSKPTSSLSFAFGQRIYAWKLLQHTMMWKLASDHPTLGISRDLIEKRILTEMGVIYKEFYVPLYVENSQAPEMVVFRRFGIKHTFSETSQRWSTQMFGLLFYMGGVLLKMRQYGLLNKLWNMGEIPQKVLLTIFRQLDTASIPWFTQTRGSYIGQGGGVFGGPPLIMIDETVRNNPEIPLNWGDWRDRKYPVTGQEDWVHASDGSFRSPDTSEHLKATWPKMRLDFFRDIPCEYPWVQVQEAANIVEGFYVQWEERMAAEKASGATARRLGTIDFQLPPGYAMLKSPNPADVEKL